MSTTGRAGEVGATAGCLAPVTSMRFNPDGMVVACCVNSRFPLGHVSTSTIREIWEGPRARRLERAIGAGDFSLGCQDCGAHVARGKRDASYAPTFDRYTGSEHPGWPSRMEFALSNRCNLMCVQCNGELSSAIRARREHRPPLRSSYDDSFFEQLPPFLAHADDAVFLGGEPFLMSEAWRIWDQLLALDPRDRPSVEVTTNGTIWNDRVERYVGDLAMTVAVSIDALTPEQAASLRVGSDIDVVLDNLHRFRSVTDRCGGGFGLNVCLMRDNWKEIPAILALGDRLDADVEVIAITHPPHRSLVLAPPREVVAALRWLERRDEQVGRELHRNRLAWVRLLDQLRDRVAADAGAPVDISTSRPEGASVPVRARDVVGALDEQRARVAHASGEQPVELVAVDGRVTEVVGSDWSAWLTEGGWVGLPVDDMASHIGRRLGSEPTVELAPLGDHLQRVDLRIGQHRFSVVVGEWLDPPHRHFRGLISRVVP